MPFQELSSILGHHVQKKGLTYQVEAAMALQYFDEIAESLWQGKMKDRAKPLYLKDQTLTVAVLSPVLAQELKSREDEVQSYINKKLGTEAVIKLRFIS
jgi:predicted nucleic acid-binding Zn ribbon protein